MSLLAPLFLLGLLAALIPVAIHLIRKDNPPQVVFSTLRFFEQTTRKQFLFQQFQQWLLLLLRALVVCLLAFAFARPFFGQSISSLADIAPKSVVIAFDVSMSMGYEDYFEETKSKATSIVNELNPGDEATLILFADDVKSVFGPTTDLGSVNNSVQGVEFPTYHSTRFLPALKLANDLLKEGRFNEKSIFLLSDFQSAGMENFDFSFKLDPGIELFTEVAPYLSDSVKKNETKNLTISGIRAPSFVRAVLEDDVKTETKKPSGKQDTSKQETSKQQTEPQDIFVSVRSVGNVKINQSSLTVTVDEEEVATVPVDLSNKSEQIVTVPITFSSLGSHFGTVMLDKDQADDDNFDNDNSVFFTVDVLPQLNVLVLNGEASKNWYDDESHWFTLALESNELSGEGDTNKQSSPFAVTVVDTKEIHSDQSVEKTLIERQLLTADVVVLLNTSDLPLAVSNALNEYVTDGGSLLFALGDRVRAGEFNNQLATFSPATLINRHLFSDNDYLLIADVKNRHPIIQPIDIDWTVRFDGYWSMKPADKAEVLMSFDNGSPALIEKQIGKGRAIIFASSLDVEWNNLPLQSVYLPFVHETLKYLARRANKKSFYSVGERIPLIEFGNKKAGSFLFDVSSESTFNLIDPSGNKIRIDSQEKTDGNENTLPSFVPDVPGIYTQYVVGAQMENENFSAIYYAVNNPVEESNLQTIPPGDMLDSILNPETTPTQSAAVRSQRLKAELEKPQRLWWWILLAVFLLLITESIVANRAHR
ncbi:MAG: BatA domain-containing protein [Cellvibrionaceae bacterium]